ncbi:hypothetical protein PHYSODRAFT_527104 [Phytophthora sojae]|uniref:HAT C-terminal dimerisation domain-containing protein n=1 Tax=Phytophthora sojae (strain P6497) TaxID=1094619 RepID=G5A891_PHYSP|nr:hypothetical protein PHYSODRAFT_527104 [Phytophthora sojae]EGZ08117.1 hypothetical protein PHYSODRAFT_527104 [Phytophthora sojae]|eukprot:XP_009536289.1 hypothetical protein PHYSODRAFT_527104 [Phytophthora sojae]
MLDGWGFHSEDYVAIFAVFEHDQRSEKALLALAPIADDGVEDQTAESHVAFLTGILPFFKRVISSIIYLVADNCSVNTRLDDLLQVPFIGCASHRLNLAVNVYLSDYEPLQEQMQQLMLKLRGLNKANRLSFLLFCSFCFFLRQKTNLRPVLRQATRWGSTFKMLDRYFDLRDALDTDDDDIVSLMPSHRQENRLRALRDQLLDFQGATMKLQEDSTTLLDVRDIFDALVEKHPVVDKYLAADAAIVKDPDFEASCFGGVRHIPPTSNAVERLFSVAKHTLSNHRHGMLPVHLETVLFLKLNRRFWNAGTVTKVVNGQ